MTHTGNAELKIIVAPEPVYTASDGTLPRWSFIIAAVNLTESTLTLIRLSRKAVGAKRTRQKTYGGLDLEELICQGDPALRLNQVVAMRLFDEGEVNGPQRVEVQMRFLKEAGGELSIRHVVRLNTQKTIYLRFPLLGRWVAANARTDLHCLGKQYGFDFVTPHDMPIHECPPKRRFVLKEFSSFGRPVFSPCEGAVVSAANGQPDCPPTPGRPSYAGSDFELHKMVGNHVILSMGENRYVLLAHLRRASVIVQSGQTVEARQRLGAVGNSGNTSGPHLHLEIMDALPDLGKVATGMEPSGLPFGFRRVTRIRKGAAQFMRRCIPAKRDVVEFPSRGV